MTLLKKVWAILLSVSLIPVFSAFAETSEKFIDNFNSFQSDTELGWHGYGAPASTYSGDVLVGQAGNGGSIDADGGPDGSAALKLNQRKDGNIVKMSTKDIDVGTASTPVVTLSYTFKIVANALDSSKSIYLGGDRTSTAILFKLVLDNGEWKFIDGMEAEEPYVYTLDNWYKLEMISTSSGIVGQIVDLATNTVVIQSENTNNRAKNLTGFNVLYLRPRSSGEDACSLVLDDVTLSMYDLDADVPESVVGTVAEGDDNVPRNKELTFEFNQKLDENSTITLLKKVGTEVTEVTGVETKKKSYNTLSVNYEGLLERNTEYVLSFEGVTNGVLNCTDSDISFTTEDLHLWDDVEVRSVDENEGEGTNITFTIGDEYNYPVFSGSVMAVVYQEGKMIAVDMKHLTKVNIGELTINFDFYVPADAEICIILLDVEKGPIPLAGGMLEN